MFIRFCFVSLFVWLFCVNRTTNAVYFVTHKQNMTVNKQNQNNWFYVYVYLNKFYTQNCKPFKL